MLDVYEGSFDFNATSLKVAEDAPIGSVVGQFIQVSGDENESVSYHLLHDENQLPVPFLLDETGRLLTTGSLVEREIQFMRLKWVLGQKMMKM